MKHLVVVDVEGSKHCLLIGPDIILLKVFIPFQSSISLSIQSFTREYNVFVQSLTHTSNMNL